MNNDTKHSKDQSNQSNQTHQGSPERPPLKAARPRFDPAKLPLVELFRLVGKLNRRRKICVSEAVAIHRVARRLGIMADFVVSGVKRDCQETDLDELYAAYKARCALKGEQPLPQGKFEQLLLLDPLEPQTQVPQAGE